MASDSIDQFLVDSLILNLLSDFLHNLGHGVEVKFFQGLFGFTPEPVADLIVGNKLVFMSNKVDQYPLLGRSESVINKMRVHSKYGFAPACWRGRVHNRRGQNGFDGETDFGKIGFAFGDKAVGDFRKAGDGGDKVKIERFAEFGFGQKKIDVGFDLIPESEVGSGVLDPGKQSEDGFGDLDSTKVFPNGDSEVKILATADEEETGNSAERGDQDRDVFNLI